MKKRQIYLALSGFLVLSIILTTLFASGIFPVKTPVTDNEDEEGSKAAGAGEGTQQGQGEIESQWVLKDSVSIVNNSPEYEVEMYLCYDKGNLPFIEVIYYMEGRSKSALYSANEIPSLKEFPDDDNKLLISEGILNTKYAKLYFFIENELNPGEILFDFYAINLKDGSARKLHGGKGHGFKGLAFSPDKAYAAYSYLVGDEGKDSFLQVFNCETDNFLAIDNKTPDGKAIGKAEDTGKIYSYFIERWKSSEELKLREYSYSWDEKKSQRNNEVEISVVFNIKKGRVVYPDGKNEVEIKNSADSTENTDYSGEQTGTGQEEQTATEKEQERETGQEEVNVIQEESASIPGEEQEESQPAGQQPDETAVEGEPADGQLPEDDKSRENGGMPGSEKEPPDSTEGTDVTGENPSYSMAVSVLESFYEYVNSRKYEEAYNLIDETIRFNVLKKILSQMFQGVEISTELNKSDIDVNFFAGLIEASGIFKNVEIDEIVKEENDGSTSKIYYYHAMTMDGTSTPVIMPVIATLRKTADGWKISAFDDG